MGLNIFNIFLLFLSFSFFVVASGFITDASRRIGNLPEKETNEDLQRAYKYSIWAAIIGWISVALLLVAGIVIFIYSAELYEAGFANYLVTGLLFFTLLGSGAVGILSALTANYINKSKVDNNNNSYRQAIIAAIISIVAFVGILIAFFIKIFYKPKPKESASDTSADIAELETELGGDGTGSVSNLGNEYKHKIPGSEETPEWVKNIFIK